MPGFDLSYLMLIAITLIVGFGTQAFIKSTFRKWGKVPISSGLTGAQAARRMLDENGLAQVSIKRVDGELTDHYDPKANVVSLSEAVFSSTSVSATAVACHECGHAVQHARGFVPARLRGVLVPAINVAGTVWMFVLIAGIVMQMLNLVFLAIALYAVTIVFQLVTLPVELDASRRALVYIKGHGYVPDKEAGGARTVLTAAALTYVAAALVSVLQLIYLLGFARR
ncbi:MAG: zinc metallopeptidase [Coriobacteriales bacterium]|jgi:Zn-dependent membrane protease YugP|nr:zinc metallopeptidase [Coriobacteriales bacterium]